jgi:hypothetical protein
VNEATQLWFAAAVDLGPVGPGVWAEPDVWGLGSTPLTAFVVKSAACRLKLLGLCRTNASFKPAEGIRPKLFAVAGLAGSGLGPWYCSWSVCLTERARRWMQGRMAPSGE